jgi:hypothetical protein
MLSPNLEAEAGGSCESRSLGPVWAIKRDPIWREERKNNKEKKER